jgi:LmbE family N-acetylglucosaminyl deacetylase
MLGGLGSLAASLPGLSTAAPARLNVVCVGAHPDDPESGCAGTLARYAETGHKVTVVYLTRGERGIEGKGLDETAAIRSGECEAACRLIGANAVFAGQIDGDTIVDRRHIEEMTKLLAAQEPDIVLTHWPLDTHPDHQAASILTVRAYLNARKRWPLYFMEVNTGYQTFGFTPTDVVDISMTVDKKKAALFAHKSQNGEEIWRKHHEVIATFRGRDLGVRHAEAFVHLGRDIAIPPGIAK